MTEHAQSESVESFEGENILTETTRRSVPGGWVYTTLVITRNNGIAATSVFVSFARFTGDDLSRRFDVSPHNPANVKTEPNANVGGIPDFSAPAPRRGEDWGRVG